MKTSLMTAAAGALAVAGCTAPQTEALSFAADVQGTWLTDGYGNLLVIRPDAVDLYDFLPGVCVPVDSTSDDPELADLVREIGIRRQDEALEIRLPLETHMRRARRLPSLPDTCGSPPDKSPGGVVEAAIRFFETHYAFMDLHGVDWPTRKRVARSAVRANMGEGELFELLTEMLGDIPDGHLGLTDDDGFVTRSFSPNSGPTTEALFPPGISERTRERRGDRFFGAYWTQTVPEQVLEGAGTRVANDRIQYGLLDGDVGYLAIITMGGYTEKETVAAELAVLNDALDEALTAFETAGVRAVLLDLSVNLGGLDQVATAIAARFATEPMRAYTKWAADAEMPVRTEKIVTPSGAVRFSGPVHLLTSDLTISAAEIATMALRALPQTVHHGSATNGSLSDILEKRLPNGWTLELSNEVYLDHTGAHWEGPGIPPDQPIEMFDLSTLDGDHSAAVRTVLDHIRAAAPARR